LKVTHTRKNQKGEHNGEKKEKGDGTGIEN
jgi:hypothetical protein